MVPALSQTISTTSPSPYPSSAPSTTITKPDFTGCGLHFANPQLPILADCMETYDLLPQGEDPVAWFVNGIIPPTERRAQYQLLPLVETRGTCQIIIQASSKYVEDHPRSPLTLMASPNSIRDAALATINRCVGNSKRGGGYSTHNFKFVTDWITAPTTVFPGDLNLEPELTFFTAMIWNPNPLMDNSTEPGSHNIDTANQLIKVLGNAESKAPEGSTLRRDLKARGKYLRESESAMVDSMRFAWWGGKRPQRASSTRM